ncbi:DUF3616 domain-containing protein, partial [Sphingobium sp. AR-3-1]
KSPRSLIGTDIANLLQFAMLNHVIASRERPNESDPTSFGITKIPAKEGGVDIEGIAVVGTRVALGMRGPVIGGHGVILELEVGVSGQGVLGLEGDPVRRLVALEAVSERGRNGGRSGFNVIPRGCDTNLGSHHVEPDRPRAS